MYIYQTAPIDFFDGLTPFEDAISVQETQHSQFTRADIVTAFAKATALAKNAKGSYWDGDIVEGTIFGKPVAATCPDAFDDEEGYNLFQKLVEERATTCSGVYVFYLPNPGNQNTYFGFVWKQSNNGTTYICSPVALPWISEQDLIHKPN